MPEQNRFLSEVPFERRLFCNRTLNMRSIRAIGYDMDYTLIHYHVEHWEHRAYEYLKQYFLNEGWPVQDFNFDPKRISRGLVVDTEKGNIVKANRFGFIRQAMHGMHFLSFEKQREVYARTIMDLAEKRWVFLNTLFSLSEGCMYAQLVDLLDQNLLPEKLSYADLYFRVRHTLDALHMEGRLKNEITSNPDRFVSLDPEVPLTLLDQFHAGKKLLLITNSEWTFTNKMMCYAFDRFLPGGMTWRDLFHLIIVSARKPQFFTTQSPFFEVATEEGLVRPMTTHLRPGVAYLGGSASQLEKYLGVSGDEILHVGDHMFGDVHITKSILRWRTVLVLQELEDELRAVESFHATEQKIALLMKKKEALETELFQGRLLLQRVRDKYAEPINMPDPGKTQATAEKLQAEIRNIDLEIAPLVKAAGELNNPYWGLLMRAGNDKSHLAFQMERYADVYTSRVSNLLYGTPFAYLRSPRGSLPHDP